MTEFIQVGNKKATTLKEYIISLQEIGIWVQPRTAFSDLCLIIFSEQRKLNPEMSFEDNCIHIIKELMGSRLVKEAVELAKRYSMGLDEYAQELRKDVVRDGQGGLSFIDESNPLNGLIEKKVWCTEPLIDPVRLEFYFNDVLRKFFTKDEADAFEKAFENYRTSEYAEFGSQKLSQRTVEEAIDNYDFYTDLFDWKSKHDRSAVRKFEKLVMDSVYAPFSQHCSFKFSVDMCYFTLGKHDFYVAIAGLRDDQIIDMCIFIGYEYS